MTDPSSTFRIFISSPGDVVEERDLVRRVIEGLQRHYPEVTLQPVLWEELALPATASFQESIDFILQQEPIDVAVFILWSRLGSPLGAAITKPDGAPYRSGTEREFDLMLAAFEQSGRRRPVILAYARDDDSGFKQRLTESPKSELQNLIEQRELADAFIREQFHDAEGHNLRAYHSYREPVGFAQRLRVHLRQTLDDLVGLDAAPRWLEAPYRGLQVFDVEHAPIFHGRDEETCDLLQRLRDQEVAGCAFAVIVGASGSGKSSLARAGVAANLVQHAGDDEVKQWQAAFMIPALGADSLTSALSRVLAETLPQLETAGVGHEQIAAGLVKDPALTVELSIAPAFTRASEKAGGPVRLLLVLDQMEELWTDRRITSEDREEILLALEALARCGHVAVLTTLRSDFYPQAQQMPTFLRLKGQRGHCDLLPPGPVALGRLITEPARLAGIRFERDDSSGRSLDQIILQDAAHDPAALPLLEYALDELYRQRDEANHRLTFAAYEKLGGVEGALGKRAETVFANLSEEAQGALPEILPLLITVDVTGDQGAVRRRAPLTELTSTLARQKLMSSLIEARFLTTDSQGGAPSGGLAHEALLVRWQRVADWITSNREHLRLRARVEQSQRRWEQQRRDASLLLPTGLPLEEGRELLRDAPHLLSDHTRDYVRTSVESDEVQARRSRRRTQAVVSALSVLTLLAMIGGVIAIWQARVADAERETALANETAANRQKGLAEDARDEAQRLRAEAEDARRRSEVATYLSQLSIVDREIRDGQITHARDLLLNRCAADLRGWEHAYLTAICLNRTHLIAKQDERIVLVDHINNGEVLVTVEANGTVQTFDHFTRKPIDRYKCEFKEDSFTSVALKRDEGRLYFGFKSGQIRVADLRDGKILKSFDAHTGSVDALAFSPEGHSMVSASNEVIEGSVDAWFWKQPQLAGESTGPLINLFKIGSGNGAISKLALSANEKLFVMSVAGDESTRISPQLQEALRQEALTKVVRQLEQKIITVFDTKSGKIEIQTFPMDGTCLAVTHSGDAFVVGDAFGKLTIFRGDGKLIAEWQAHEKGVTDVAYIGGLIASVSPDRTLRVWDPVTAERLLLLSTNDAIIESLTPHPFEPVVITCDTDGNLRSWDLDRYIFRRTIEPIDQDQDRSGEPLGNAVLCLAIRPDGQRIAAGLENGLVGVWDLELNAQSPEQRDSRSLSHSVNQVAFDRSSGAVVALSDGKLEVSGENSNSIRVPDIFAEKSNITAFAVDEKTHLFAVALKSNEILVSDATRIEVAKGSVGVIAFSDQGQNLLWSTADNSVTVWSLEEQKVIAELSGHSDTITSIAISPNNLLVATASEDQTIKIWSRKTGREIYTLRGHDHQVNAVVFNASGTRLASGSADATVRLWHVESGLLLRTLKDIQGAVTSVAFSPNEMHLSCGTRNGKIVIWSIPQARTTDSNNATTILPEDADVYLDDLEEVDFHVGHGTLGKHGATGYEVSKMFSQVKFNRTIPVHAISMPPPANGSSYVVYALGEKFRRLETEGVILNSDNATGRPASPLTFRILGDDFVLYESKPLQNFRDSTGMIDLDVTGVRSLRLEVECPGANDFARAAWINPRLTHLENSPD